VSERSALSDGYVEVVQGDITRQEVDAIVNAANNALRGGGGVDGAIHRVAGPELNDACRQIGWCPTGEAVITPGFRLPATWIIHTVGPVWHGGDRDEDALLASCYRSSMELAHERGIRSIAFPSISTGVYGFPVKRAAAIAIETLRDMAIRHPEIRTVRMVTFGDETYSAYADELEATMD
jgi:O-acetyl-ADP-ribose deacetylase (regulator of RNase III)